jgi:hypothetical protein
LALMLVLPSARAQVFSAEQLLEVAFARWQQGGGGEASAPVSALLNRIETEHPDSDLSLQITLMRSRGMSDGRIVAQLNSSVSSIGIDDSLPDLPAGSDRTDQQRALTEGDRLAEIERSHREGMTRQGSARAEALARTLGLLEQAALEHPQGETAQRLRYDQPVRGIDPGSMRRELAELRQSAAPLPTPLPPQEGVIADRDTKKDENAVSTH